MTNVSLGSNCSVSHFLRKKKLRNYAYPFDWLITPFSSALDLISNNFEGFLDEKNLIFLDPVKRFLLTDDGKSEYLTDDIITPVLNKRYGILFAHDFSQHGSTDLSMVQKKYNRRIDRLLREINDENRVRFVWVDSELNKWQSEQYQKAGMDYMSCCTKKRKKLILNFVSQYTDVEFVSLRRIMIERNIFETFNKLKIK